MNNERRKRGLEKENETNNFSIIDRGYESNNEII